MDETPRAGETPFSSRNDYQRAVDVLLGCVQGQLCIFDVDLKALALEAPQRVEVLKGFLLARRGNRLRIVLHELDHVERGCPRLMDLLRHFNHAMEIRRTPADLRHLTECYALADTTAAAIRFHAAHDRGKLLLDLADELAEWRQRFDELWELSEPGIAATTLGL